MNLELLVAYRDSGGTDAIDAYSRRLVAALRARGLDASYMSSGLRHARDLVSTPDWVVLQYQPFSFGRWGVAPGLLRDAVLLRRQGARLGIMVHEAWVPVDGLRSLLMASYQHGQLRALLGLAAAVWTSTDALAVEIGGGARPLPVGSNVCPVSCVRSEARARLHLTDEFVVTLFGGGHPSRQMDYAEAAIDAIARALADRRICVVNLGDGAPPIRVPPGTELRQPGPLGDAALSEHLKTTDLVLLPFTDGLSTRRTTLMAVLAHGLALAGLVGPRTDAVLTRSTLALALCPIGDKAGFARLAAALARDPVRRELLGTAGRRLYEEEFSWPRIAERVVSGIGAAEGSGRSVVGSGRFV